jgi:excisionase family DNA binding protein
MRRAEPESRNRTSAPRGCKASVKPSARRLTPEQVDHLRRQPPLILSAAEAAVYTDTSERNFRELAERGVFPSIRVGRRVLFRRDAIDAALGKLEVQNLARMTRPPGKDI